MRLGTEEDILEGTPSARASKSIDVVSIADSEPPISGAKYLRDGGILTFISSLAGVIRTNLRILVLY
jgi:hypothetical protein